MPSPCFSSFIKIIWQLIFLEEHNVRYAGQDTHIPRALLGSGGLGAHTMSLWCLGGLAGWDNQMLTQHDGRDKSLVGPELPPDPHLKACA